MQLSKFFCLAAFFSAFLAAAPSWAEKCHVTTRAFPAGDDLKSYMSKTFGRKYMTQKKRLFFLDRELGYRAYLGFTENWSELSTNPMVVEGALSCVSEDQLDQTILRAFSAGKGEIDFGGDNDIDNFPGAGLPPALRSHIRECDLVPFGKGAERKSCFFAQRDFEAYENALGSTGDLRADIRVKKQGLYLLRRACLTGRNAKLCAKASKRYAKNNSEKLKPLKEMLRSAERDKSHPLERTEILSHVFVPPNAGAVASERQDNLREMMRKARNNNLRKASGKLKKAWGLFIRKTGKVSAKGFQSEERFHLRHLSDNPRGRGYCSVEIIHLTDIIDTQSGKKAKTISQKWTVNLTANINYALAEKGRFLFGSFNDSVYFLNQAGIRLTQCDTFHSKGYEGPKATCSETPFLIIGTNKARPVRDAFLGLMSSCRLAFGK